MQYKNLHRLFSLSILILSCNRPGDDYSGWEVYNGTKDGVKYSSLDQINTENVKQLAVAWTYHTGDADTLHSSQIQCNPVVVDGLLFGVSPQLKLFAVDAATGAKRWVFDPNPGAIYGKEDFAMHNCRGVAYWTDGKNKRIFYTAASKTFAVDAITGKIVKSFGKGGWIDLHDDLGRDAADLFVVNTSPGIIYNDLLILGSRVNEAPPSAPGHIRAYNVLTGKLVWIFHTIPQPGEPGYDTWDDPKAWEHTGGANAWSGFSLDEKRGILFAPTGSAAYDFYGGNRKGANLFANCLLALDAGTGKLIWHFQVLHHDLWDKDLPAPPVLVTLKNNGKQVDAVAQITKNGQVFVFERETGKPLFDIDEIPVDTVSDLKGEKVWPTQPVPRKPIPFARQKLTDSDVNPYLGDSARERLQQTIRGFRHGNMFIPPGKIPSLVFPGYDGGGEWGGPAVDPRTGLLYVNSNEMAWIMQMNEIQTNLPANESWVQAGNRLYQQNCMICHGTDYKGSGNSPSLIDLKSRSNKQEFMALMDNGRRMMPSFRHLANEEKEALASLILEIGSDQDKPFKFVAVADEVSPLPYKLNGYIKFLGHGDYPAISPPWGTLSAIDLNTGEFVWQEVLGEYPELTEKGIAPTGTENYGGPVVTAGGLVFIAATRDAKFRAFDKKTGKVLWEYNLPAPAFATPAVFEANGREYVVVACGGGKLSTRSADAYVAFALE
ncbi:MAG TPA: PQQ-binding-like beta-propeller repeat protein [Bacteroidales bacterium]|jgi:quinoprotein glucose dehydrogenase|nr:PQQ-binding-like beta-propeller repeat protein [Bacteroidales bacterium]